MEIQIRSQGPELTSTIREWAQRRVFFALGQFSSHIRCVRMCLSDDNGPKGGVDQRCLMEARLMGAGEIVADVLDVDLQTAISRAAERLGRRIRTKLERERSQRRSPDFPKRKRRPRGSNGAFE